MILLYFIIFHVAAVPVTSKSLEKGNFLAKQDDALPAPACEISYELHGEWCYKFREFYKFPTVDELRKYCLDDGGDLVSIHSKEEDEYLRSVVGDNNVIGLQYDGKSSFTWFDGTELDYENIDKNFVEYSLYFGNCVKNGPSWVNTECGIDDEVRIFICKKKAFLTSNCVCPDPDKIFYGNQEVTSSGYPALSAGKGESCIYKFIVLNDYLVMFQLADWDFHCGVYGEDGSTLVVYDGFIIDDSYIIGTLSCTSGTTRFYTKKHNRMTAVFTVPVGSFASWRGAFNTLNP